jgi:hypothetical protein
MLLALPQFTLRAEEKAEPGEERLEGEAARQALAGIAEVFRRQPCVRARIACEREDLIGRRREEGEIVFQRPGRVLRRFGPPGRVVKALRLEGEMLLEYVPKEGVVPRDFSQAPKALALVRAAFTLDTETLVQYFTIALFRKAGAEGRPAQWRIVLTRRSEKAELPLAPRIQARLDDGAAFFREIWRAGETADDYVVEEYSDIRAEKTLTDRDFDEPLLRENRREAKVVSEIK